ncbi:pseudouridine synthase [Anthocerotibacter panamensis]|uniref:pseudouridine synthase n=1 Tax=Anthocerotibacter panamensis TaxID=2857077 RepID=UPI001C407A6C|nr:pseudouridine synthase [Anthocerotibacter panamensis]
MAAAVRLQKYLASHGLCSRRRAEELIAAGAVQVNGQTVTQLGTCIDPTTAEVRVHGQLLSSVSLRYYLVHKPRGLVSTCFDPQGRPTVLSLLPSAERQGLYPVGRLDQESEGALLLTNDGALTQKLTHPSHVLWKVYRVWVRGIPTAEALAAWRRGIPLDGRLTLPARVQVLLTQGERTQLEVHLREGRNRQIRRIAQLLGYPIQSLTRVAIGPLVLGDLPAGKYRSLTHREVQQLHAAPSLMVPVSGLRS